MWNTPVDNAVNHEPLSICYGGKWRRLIALSWDYLSNWFYFSSWSFKTSITSTLIMDELTYFNDSFSLCWGGKYCSGSPSEYDPGGRQKSQIVYLHQTFQEKQNILYLTQGRLKQCIICTQVIVAIQGTYFSPGLCSVECKSAEQYVGQLKRVMFCKKHVCDWAESGTSEMYSPPLKHKLYPLWSLVMAKNCAFFTQVWHT